MEPAGALLQHLLLSPGCLHPPAPRSSMKKRPPPPPGLMTLGYGCRRSEADDPLSRHRHRHRHGSVGWGWTAVPPGNGVSPSPSPPPPHCPHLPMETASFSSQKGGEGGKKGGNAIAMGKAQAGGVGWACRPSAADCPSSPTLKLHSGGQRPGSRVERDEGAALLLSKGVGWGFRWLFFLILFCTDGRVRIAGSRWLWGAPFAQLCHEGCGEREREKEAAHI